jgi:phytoene desaturase
MLDPVFHRAPAQGLSHPHAVVIGSGFGGLAAAVRLGAKGYRVSVLEKLDAPGGRAYVYRQDGFTFDAGPTIVTAPFLFEELWTLCGRKLSDDVTLVPVSPFYRIRFHDGSCFDYSGDAAAMRAEIARLSPGDVGGYDGYMKASEEIFKVGFERLGDVPFSRWTDMARIAPEMIRLSSYRSVYGLVSKFFSDPRLRIVFSFHPLLIGGNPFTASSIYCLIAFLERRWGVHFAMGGTGRLVDGLVKLILGQRGPGRPARVGTDRRGRHCRFQCRFGLDLPASAAGVSAAAMERQTDRARQLFHEPVRLVFRHAMQICRRAASHHPARTALQGIARRHLRAQGSG